jgi:hypothetical protein
MNEDHVEKLIETGALSASNVLARFITDETRFRKVKFLVSDADKVELREMLIQWAKARRQD